MSVSLASFRSVECDERTVSLSFRGSPLSARNNGGQMCRISCGVGVRNAHAQINSIGNAVSDGTYRYRLG